MIFSRQSTIVQSARVALRLNGAGPCRFVQSRFGSRPIFPIICVARKNEFLFYGNLVIKPKLKARSDR